MRSFFVVVLIVLGGLLAVPAGIVTWLETAIFDEDAFVATVDDAFEREEVQTALAERLTDEIMQAAEVRERIGDALAEIEDRGPNDPPEGVALLEGPLTAVARDVILRLAVAVFEAQPLEDVREGALRGAHRAVTAIIDNDAEALSAEGDDVVLDLGVVLEEIIKDVSGDKGEQFLESIEFPEDAGKIVLVEDTDVTAVWTLSRWLNDYGLWVAIAPVAVFALATVISPHRRRSVMAVGVTLVVVAGIEILLVAAPLREATVRVLGATPSGEAATRATYDVVLNSFQRQQAFVALFGVGLVAGGWLAGDAQLATAIRSSFRRRRPAAGSQGFVPWVRERGQALRVGGLGASVLLLIAWPDPSTRFVVTVLILTAAYLAVVTATAGDADWAVSARTRAADLWNRYFRVPEPVAAEAAATSSLAGWAVARASWFRVGGIALGAILLVFWQSLTLLTFIVVVTLVFLYLAGIDMIVKRSTE